MKIPKTHAMILFFLLPYYIIFTNCRPNLCPPNIWEIHRKTGNCACVTSRYIEAISVKRYSHYHFSHLLVIRLDISHLVSRGNSPRIPRYLSHPPSVILRYVLQKRVRTYCHFNKMHKENI